MHARWRLGRKFYGVAEFQNEGPYEVRCPQGHQSSLVLQEQRFEILFAIGGHAVLDGYYREAVSSFSSSLERLYEYFCRAALTGHCISSEKIEQAWKSLAPQSERQLGAFVLLYLREIGEPPPTLNQRTVKFRNDVIHKGIIPTREEAIAYGEEILALARTILAAAHKYLSDGVEKLAQKHVANEYKKAAKLAAGTITIPTILSSTKASTKSLEEELVDLEKWRQFIGQQKKI